MFKSIAISISFLTCLPINPGHVDASDMRRAVSFFPFAGLVLGLLITICAWAGMYYHLPTSVLAVLMTTLLAYLTRGLHLDGVADLADGFGGSLEPGRRLEIMKDSATGSFGVIALFAVLGLKVTCFAQLFEYGFISLLLILMACISARFWMVVIAVGATYPRQSGTGHFIIGNVNLVQVLTAALFLFPLYFAVMPCLVVLVSSAIPPLFLRIRAGQLIGGVTGDVLGASVEWSEAFGLLAGLVYLSMLG